MIDRTTKGSRPGRIPGRRAGRPWPPGETEAELAPASFLSRQALGRVPPPAVVQALQRALGNQGTLRLLAETGPEGARAAPVSAAGESGTSVSVQRIDDEDLDAMSKEEKKKYNAIRATYADALGVGKPLYDYAEDDFDYHRREATSLSDLEKRVKDAIEKAKKAHAAASQQPTTSAATQPQTPGTSTASPPPGVVPPTPQGSTSSPSGPTSPPSTTTTAKKKKKGGTSKDVTAQYVVAKPTKQQAIPEKVDPVTNPMIQGLISNRPASATRAMGTPQVSADTVYFDLEVRVPEPNHPGYPRILVYNVEVHYHPVPTSQNYLHVKRTAASDPGNTVQLNNWLIDLGVLRQGRQAWDSVNPSNPSPHTF